MDYINIVATGTLLLYVLPLADLKQMLSHIEESLLTTMHLPVSSEDTLHFYRYLCTHILIANRQVSLLIDFPIQGWMQQISMYRIFALEIPYGNFTAHYEVDTKYLVITWDETMAVDISINNTVHVSKVMDSSATSIYHFNLMQTDLLALQH